MSIIIKGMDMPECCDSCCFAYWSIFHQTAMCSRNNKPCFANFSIEYRTKRPDWCPLEEAKPVLHGQWVWDKENDKMYCSKCGYRTDNWGVNQESDPIEWQLPNYCENCGADMRREREEDATC